MTKVGPNYTDTNEPIKVGDKIYFDTYAAVVAGVFMPNTTESEDYNCEDTGGLLLSSEKFGMVLEPFGTHNQVVKRK